MQAGGYYMGMLAYFWVLATPAVGFSSVRQQY